MRRDLPVEELEQMANVEIGEALRCTRLHYGKTIPDIEKALRIRASQIDAIECGDVERLPGRVYAIGFVRSYAEYLGLDGAQVVQLFKAQYMDGPDKQSLSFPMSVAETKTPAIWLVVFCLLLASGVLVYFNERSALDRSSVLQVDPVPDSLQSHVERDVMVPVMDNLFPSEDDGVSDSQDIDVSEGVVLKFTGSSWAEIKKADNQVLISQVFEQGDVYAVPQEEGLVLSLGNAVNVDIQVNGTLLKPLGGVGDVRRNISLNPDYLLTLETVDIPKDIGE